MSKRLSEDLSNLSYHVRCLAGLGILRLAYTRRVRGAVEHFYVLDSALAKRPIIDAVVGGPAEGEELE
jgi:hypothetical protein